MGLSLVLVFMAAAIAAGLSSRWRNQLLLVYSLVFIYIMQPALPIRGLDFWLPTLTLFICILIWFSLQNIKSPWSKKDSYTLIFIFTFISIVGINRYFDRFCCLTPTIPPNFTQVFLGIVTVLILAYLFRKRLAGTQGLFVVLAMTILAVLTIIKSPFFSQQASFLLRNLSGQESNAASSLDIRWLGFSYIAFRLVHAIRDRSANRINDPSLRDFIVYIIFFPTLASGPIDRIQRFTGDLATNYKLNTDHFWSGGKRIFLGLFKKYAVADTLALISLNDLNASQTSDPFWIWVLVYCYAFRLYFDFSGYIDIAIGLSRWMGFQLPENFENPYLKQNLTQFWNSWHITLAKWFRAYFFNPITRLLRSKYNFLPVWLIIMIGQFSTMALLGLWHGIQWNYFIWGIWHGIGLFIHNRWSTVILPKRIMKYQTIRINSSVIRWGGMVLTFNFVAVGWVWFALSDPYLSLSIIGRMFGLVR